MTKNGLFLVCSCVLSTPHTTRCGLFVFHAREIELTQNAKYPVRFHGHPEAQELPKPLDFEYVNPYPKVCATHLAVLVSL